MIDRSEPAHVYRARVLAAFDDHVAACRRARLAAQEATEQLSFIDHDALERAAIQEQP